MTQIYLIAAATRSDAEILLEEGVSDVIQTMLHLSFPAVTWEGVHKVVNKFRAEFQEAADDNELGQLTWTETFNDDNEWTWDAMIGDEFFGSIRCMRDDSAD